MLPRGDLANHETRTNPHHETRVCPQYDTVSKISTYSN